MNIKIHEKPSKQTKKDGRSPEALFEKAWKRVISQQKKNSKLREELKAFSERVSEAIQDQEKAYVNTLYQTCEHLLVFYGRKSLTQWQRQVLMDWIADYISTIRNNPFAADLDLAPLLQQVDAMLAKVHPEMMPELSGAIDSADADNYQEPSDAADDERMDDMFEDLFAEFGQDADFDEQDSFDFGRQQAFEEERQAKEQALNKLMKGSSINKLFRKVARVLHPDLEQDEDARAEKNRLMGELVQARDSKDIVGLFALYTEHVGKSPLEDLGGDLAGATELLQRQYEFLRDEQEDMPYEDPFAGVLYERFHKKTDKATWRNIEAHLSDLKQDMANLRLFREQATSVNKLKPYLEARLEYMQDYRFEVD